MGEPLEEALPHFLPVVDAARRRPWALLLPITPAPLDRYVLASGSSTVALHRPKRLVTSASGGLP